MIQKIESLHICTATELPTQGPDEMTSPRSNSNTIRASTDQKGQTNSGIVPQLATLTAPSHAPTSR